VLLAAGALFIGLAVEAHALQPGGLREGQVAWQTYGEAAFQRAAAEKKPVFLYFFADWCGWCRRYEAEVLENPSVRARLTKEFIPVAVNIDTRRDLFKRHGGTAVPMTQVIDGTRKVFLRFQGLVEADALTGALDQAREKYLCLQSSRNLSC
jgi:thiol:disulfide interchange protein